MNIRINNEVNHNIQGEKYKVDKYPGLTIRLHMFINRYQTQISSREKKKHSYESQVVYYYRLYLNRLTMNTEPNPYKQKIICIKFGGKMYVPAETSEKISKSLLQVNT